MIVSKRNLFVLVHTMSSEQYDLFRSEVSEMRNELRSLVATVLDEARMAWQSEAVRDNADSIAVAEMRQVLSEALTVVRQITTGLAGQQRQLREEQLLLREQWELLRYQGFLGLWAAYRSPQAAASILTGGFALGGIFTVIAFMLAAIADLPTALIMAIAYVLYRMAAVCQETRLARLLGVSAVAILPTVAAPVAAEPSYLSRLMGWVWPSSAAADSPSSPGAADLQTQTQTV